MKRNLASNDQLLHLLNTFALVVRHYRHLQCLPKAKRGAAHRDLLAQAAAEVDDLTFLHLMEPTGAEQETPVPGVTDIPPADRTYEAVIVDPSAI